MSGRNCFLWAWSGDVISSFALHPFFLGALVDILGMISIISIIGDCQPSSLVPSRETLSSTSTLCEKMIDSRLIQFQLRAKTWKFPRNGAMGGLIISHYAECFRCSKGRFNAINRLEYLHPFELLCRANWDFQCNKTKSFSSGIKSKIN